MKFTLIMECEAPQNVAEKTKMTKWDFDHAPMAADMLEIVLAEMRERDATVVAFKVEREASEVSDDR